MLKAIQKLLSRPLKLLENKYIAGVMQIFIILYASMIAPRLPRAIEGLLKNVAVKIILISLILYLSNKNISLSLMIAVGFVMSMQGLRQLEQAREIKDVLKIAVNVPRRLAKDVIDGVQDIPQKAAEQIGGPVEDVVGAANKIIDGVQEATGDIIDSVQGALL